MGRADQVRRRRARAPRGRGLPLWLGGVALLGGWLAVTRLVPALVRGTGEGAPNSFEPSGRGPPAVPASRQARSAGHETKEMSGGLMGRLVFMLGTVALCVVFGMAGLHTWLRHRDEQTQQPLTALEVAPVRPPLPHLQTDPVGDLARLRGQEDALLGGYAFLDPGHTRARIPIGRAMELTIGHGLEHAP